MAFGGGSGSGRVKSDINVTPLVDVVLVLLIIFLVAMPIVMRMVQVDVPKKLEDPPQDLVVPDQITVEITKANGVLLNGRQIDRVDLAEKLRIMLESKREKIVFVDFDDSVRYGDAVSVMDTVKGVGGTVALKLKEEDGAGGEAAPAPSAPGAPAPGSAPAPAPAPTPRNP